MGIAINQASTFNNIPSFVPYGVLWYTLDTDDLYIGTGASKGPAVTFIAGGGGSGSTPDTVVQISTSQTLSLPTSGNLYVECTAGSGGIIPVLPTAVGYSGQKVTFIQVDAGAGGVLIETTSAQTINGGTNYELTNRWQSVTLESNNANWRIVATAG